MGPLVLLLVVLSAAFAASLGAHYTGACMGMAHAAQALPLRRALWIMAPLTVVGALVASGRVELTVGEGLLGPGSARVGLAVAVVGAALALTAAYNVARLPTSTIQILVFAVVGAGLSAGLAVRWATIEALVVVWAVAPPAAFLVGFVGLRLHDRFARGGGAVVASRPLAGGLVAAGALVSFVMGANDVSNASGPLVLTGEFGLLEAAGIGAAGLAVGVLTWGRPLLVRVAKEIVRLDPRMATLAQVAQGSVVIVAVAFGYFTSLNQALVGGLAGVGYARGRQEVHSSTLLKILVGWAVGPLSGALAGFALETALRWVGVS